MTRLNRYIGHTVGAAILLVLLVIIGIDVIGALIEQSGELKGQYDFLAALRFVLMSVPGSVFEFLPYAALVGCLAGLGVLANNSELIVIRSAGVSTLGVVWAVLRPTVLILVLGFLISEYVAPVTQSVAQSERAIALRSDEDVVSKRGLWHREGLQFMHFGAVQPNGVLYGVTIYQFDVARRLHSTLFAERATYQQERWLLEDVSTSSFLEDRVEQRHDAFLPWATELTPQLLNILVLDPIDLPVSGLWHYFHYLRQQGLSSGLYELAFWEKVLQPASTLALVLMAISFIFGPLRQVTMGYRIFTGVLVGIVFRTVQDMLAPASMVYGFPAVMASLGPILLCALIGLLLLKRAR